MGYYPVRDTAQGLREQGGVPVTGNHAGRPGLDRSPHLEEEEAWLRETKGPGPRAPAKA